MRTELNKLHQQIGKTTIYVTHDQAEAMTLGDRIAVLNKGHLQQVGPPDEVYDSPVNMFVAGFIGEPATNFIPIDLNDEGDRWRITSDLFELTLPETFVDQYPVSDWIGQDLTLGVRPEDLHDAEINPGQSMHENTFTAYVEVLEPLGADNYITFTDAARETGSEFTARIDPESTVIEGEQLNIFVNMDAIHIFDERTGDNLTI